MWDPSTYLRFADERSRPFFDLVSRIGATAPAEVVDLGCGPGNLTATLAGRWPGARIVGIDSSTEMIERARAGQTSEALSFDVADLRDWRPGPAATVVISNATLHWVPDHERLIEHWCRALPAGAWLAVQVPGNADAPSHVALRASASRSRWRERLVRAAEPRRVPDPQQYAHRLHAAGCAVDAWETTYLHLLPATGSDHPVLTWMEGTALRPVRAALDDDDWALFRADLTARLVSAYPVLDGLVAFPFRRVFVVARTGGMEEGTPSTPS